MLTNALNVRSVTVCAEAGDWRDAVEISGGLLVTSGAAEEGYVSSMVRTVEELGAYAVIAPGVAIPHARPEDGAKKVGLSLVVLSKPVEFGSKENDPVDLVFGFVTTDSDAHVELIQALADFIEVPENPKALREARHRGSGGRGRSGVGGDLRGPCFTLGYIFPALTPRSGPSEEEEEEGTEAPDQTRTA